MNLRRTLFALLGLSAGSGASPASKTTRNGPDKVVVRAPPIPTSTLVTDFQKDGVNSSWAEGHPKAWGAETVKFKGPLVVDVFDKFIALAARDNLTIRDIDTLEIVSTSKTGHEGNANSVVIIPDVDGGYNAFVETSNYSTYNAITQVRLSSTGAAFGETTQYPGTFSSFDGRRGPFSPDGRRFLVIGNRPLEKSLIIYDIDNQESNVTLTGHLGSIMSADFSPDGTLVSSTGWDGYGKIWNASTGELLHDFPSSGSQNWLTLFSPDGKYVIVANAGREAAVKIWPVSDLSAEPIIIKNFGNWVRAASWSPDSKLLATGSYGLIQIYSLDEKRVVQRWEMEDRLNFEAMDFTWIKNEGSGLQLAYRTTAGLEVYDFEANLKYRWGPDAYAQYDGGGSGDGTYLIKTQGKGLIGGGDADSSIRFYEFPL